MRTIEEEMVDEHDQTLAAAAPGNQALAEIQAGQAQDRAKVLNDEADKKWREVGSPIPDYDHRAAHAAGVDIVKGELPNKFLAPGSRNVGGYDLATNTRYTSVVSQDYQGTAAHGALTLWGSASRPGEEPPSSDSLGLSAFAAAYQGSGKTYEQFNEDFSTWGDPVLSRAWRAGTDSLRHHKVSADLANNAEMLGIYEAQATAMPFDVRMADAGFQKAAKTIFKHFNGAEFQDTDAAASKWLATHFRNLDWNTPMAAAIFLKAKNAPWEVHQAYADALQMWEMTNMERRIVPQIGNFSRMIMDPANLMGGFGKIYISSAARFAFKNFMQSMAAAAFAGSAAGVVNATAKAGVQGNSPTAGELALGVATNVGMAYGVPAAASVAGKGIKAGVNALKSKFLPELPPGNVVPRGVALEGEYIPAGAGEAVQAGRAGAKPQQVEKPVVAQPAQQLEAPVNLEQQPWEGQPGFETPPAGDPTMQEAEGGRIQFAGMPNPQGEGMPRPAMPRDPYSGVFVDPATGYYSPAQAAVARSEVPAMTAGDWRKLINAEPNRKVDELSFLDLESLYSKYGKNDKIPKEDLLAHIDRNLVKIQRYQLVPPVDHAMNWKGHMLDVNPEYARLSQDMVELEDEMIQTAQAHQGYHEELSQLQDEIAEAKYKTADVGPDDPRHQSVVDYIARRETAIREIEDKRNALVMPDYAAEIARINAHMDRIASEERSAAIASGKIPPGIEGIEHMVTDPNRGGEARDLLERMFAQVDEINKLSSPAYQAEASLSKGGAEMRLRNAERALENSWHEMDALASDMGAIVTPDSLDKVEGFVRFGNPEVRGAALVGRDEPGARIRNGVDPLQHQIAMYHHPEGLKLQGFDSHPGGSTPGVIGWAITSLRQFADGTWMHFVDEGQNDFVKARKSAAMLFEDWKKFLTADPTEATSLEAKQVISSKTYDDWVWARYRNEKIMLAEFDAMAPDTSKAARERVAAAMPEKWKDVSASQQMEMMKDPLWNDTIRWETDLDPEMVALPKQLFGSTALSGIFKSELYNAARSGRDWFGWTTVETLHDRQPHNAPVTYPTGIVQFIPDERRFDRIIMRQGGQNRGSLTFDEANKLADKLGEAGAPLRKLTHSVSEYHRMQDELFAPPAPAGHMISLNMPRIEKEPGKLLHYDVQTKQQMEKFAETIGAEVVRKMMPKAPGSEKMVSVWAIEITPKVRKRLLEGDAAKGMPPGVPIGAAAATAAGLAAQQPQEETQ